MNCAMRTDRCWAGRMYQLLRGEAAGGQADWADCRCMEIRLAGDWRAEKDGRGVMRNLERCCILFSFINPTTQSTYRQTPIFLFVSML